MNIVLVSTYNNRFALEILDRALKRSLPISAIVFTNTRKTKKEEEIFEERYPSLTKMEVSDFSTHHIPIYFTSDFKGEGKALLKHLQADMVLQGGGPIYPEEIIQTVPYGVLNIHPGLLPDYRGCTAVEWAIHNDDPVGATCHLLDAGIDTGPILFKKELPITEGMTYTELRTAMFFLQADMMIEGAEQTLSDPDHRNLEVQPESDVYWDVIPESKLQEVKQKLLEKRYKHYV